MTFTDDDLRQLKEHLAGDCYRSDEWESARNLMPSLIARLEAAEKVCEWESKYEIPDNTDIELSNLLANWRKAAGK